MTNTTASVQISLVAGPQFRQNQIWLRLKVLAQLLAVNGQDIRLATGLLVLWPDIAEPPALLDQLLDYAERHPKAPGHHLSLVSQAS